MGIGAAGAGCSRELPRTLVASPLSGMSVGSGFPTEGMEGCGASGRPKEVAVVEGGAGWRWYLPVTVSRRAAVAAVDFDDTGVAKGA